MLFTYVIRKNFQCVLYAMFKYFLNGSNLNPLVVLTHKMHAGGSDFRLYDGSDLKTYLLMRW